MPSNDRITQALKVLARSREAYFSSVAMSAEEVRGILERESVAADKDPKEKLAQELGPFAAGRIDMDRLVSFAPGKATLDPAKRDRIHQAYDTLVELRKAGDDLFSARCELDGYLRGTIVKGLARAGRAFGAARVVEAALTGIPEAEGVEDPLSSFSPDRWNRAEKGWAPPLVVEVEGQDLKVASLGELLSGSQKIVLVVNEPAPPASLVRLITPGVTVIQTDDPAELAPLEAASGPAIAALMPAGVAKFVHKAGGDTLGQRLEVKFLPEKEPKRGLGTISAFQQAEELQQLASLSAPVELVAPRNGDKPQEGVPMDEVGQLAAWLIHQAKI
jgi:hypothetical protein